MAPRKPGKKDFDMERMYRKLIPSMPVDSLPDLGPEPASQDMDGESVRPEEGASLHVNLMELILQEKMDHTIKMLRCCDCIRCRSDIIACALNQLPSFFAVDESRFADKITELRRQYEVKAVSALILAVQKIKSNPRH